MRIVLIIVTMLMSKGAMAQVTMVDVVKVKGEYEKEALYFYENNWKVFREKALEEKFISGFELVKSKADSAGTLTLVLVTRFGDDATYRDVEKNFRGIMQSVAPNGPKMMNTVPRKDFIMSVTSYSGKSVAWGGK